jgi:protein-tyrosine phosphatase
VILRDTTSLVDIHNHLVPAVDDGAKHVPAVLASIERFTRVGVRRIVTTPHIQASMTLQPDRLEERLATVTVAWETAAAAVKEDFPEVEYRRGHEVLIDVPEADLSDPRLRMAGTSFVLVEWPRLHVPPGTPRVLKWIREQGHRPIIAHPERYVGMGHAPSMAARWRDAGAFLQVNYGSLVGRYGMEAQTVAFRLLEAGHVDYLASDFHGHAHVEIYKTEAWAALKERDALETLDTLCRTNPSRVLEDQDPLPVPSLSPEQTFLARLRGMIKRETV